MLDELLEQSDLGALPERDRALVRTIVATVLRRLGTLRHVLATMLEKGMPSSAPKVEDILLIGAAQILFLDVPDHASVDLSVRLAQADPHASHYSGLVNGVLRKLARDGKARLAGLDTALLDTPEWLMQRWIAQYGDTAARAIAMAHTQEPALDLTVKQDPQGWAATLNGRVLDTGTVRTIASGPLPQFPGYDDGAWWVQDAAAALPARLLGAVRGRAARPRSSSRPARRSPRSIARRRAWSGCGRTWRGFSSAPRSSRPTPRRLTAGRSTRCWWTHPARRPEQSAAIPTSPG